MPGSRPGLCALILVFCTTTALGSNPPRLLIVSFDGFRYNYVNSSITPNLMALREKGTYTPYMINVFPTKTFPNHHAIGTYVEHHGVFGSKCIENKTTIKYGQQMLTFNKTVLPIWAVNQKAGRYSGSMMWLGGEFTYGSTVATFHRALNDTEKWEDNVERALQWFKNETTPTNLVMMYFNQPDKVSHSKGSDSDLTRLQIVRIDSIVKYLETSLSTGQLDDVNVFLLSDHGMADVPYENVIDLRPDTNPVLKAVADRYVTVGSSPIYQVVPLTGSEEMVYDAFHNVSLVKGNIKVYRKADLPPEWHVKNSIRMTEIVVLADLGYGFHDIFDEFNIRPGDSVGVHGYDNRLMQMHPFFQAFGPLVKKGHVMEPFNNIDLFSLWCHIIGVEDIQSDGNFNNVKGMLVDSGVSNSRSSGVNIGRNTGISNGRNNNWLCISVVLMLVLTMLCCKTS